MADVMTDPANLPVLPAILKRKKQEEQRASVRRKLAPSPEDDVQVVGGIHCSRQKHQQSNRTIMKNPPPGTTAPTAMSITNKKLLRAKVLVAKSQAKSTNIARQMGKIAELEKATRTSQCGNYALDLTIYVVLKAENQ